MEEALRELSEYNTTAVLILLILLNEVLVACVSLGTS